MTIAFERQRELSPERKKTISDILMEVKGNCNLYASNGYSLHLVLYGYHFNETVCVYFLIAVT